MALFESKEKKLKKQQEAEAAKSEAEFQAKFAAKQEKKKVEKTGVAWVAQGTAQHFLEPTKLLRHERHTK